MNLSDFRESKYWTAEGTYWLWGNKLVFGVVLDEDVTDKNQVLEEYLPVFNQKLQWLEQNRPLVEEALVEKGLVSLAEDWVAGAAPVEEDRECYLLEDGQKVYLPIPKEDFCRSITIDGLTFYGEEGVDRIMADVFLRCTPDYFAGHTINFMLQSDNSIVVNGLWG